MRVKNTLSGRKKLSKRARWMGSCGQRADVEFVSGDGPFWTIRFRSHHGSGCWITVKKGTGCWITVKKRTNAGTSSYCTSLYCASHFLQIEGKTTHQQIGDSSFHCSTHSVVLVWKQTHNISAYSSACVCHPFLLSWPHPLSCAAMAAPLGSFSLASLSVFSTSLSLPPDSRIALPLSLPAVPHSILPASAGSQRHLCLCVSPFFPASLLSNKINKHFDDCSESDPCLSAPFPDRVPLTWTPTTSGALRSGM